MKGTHRYIIKINYWWNAGCVTCVAIKVVQLNFNCNWVEVNLNQHKIIWILCYTLCICLQNKNVWNAYILYRVWRMSSYSCHDFKILYRPELYMTKIIMLIIHCIILFRNFYNFPTLYSKFHALFSKLFLRLLSNQSINSWNHALLQCILLY